MPVAPADNSTSDVAPAWLFLLDGGSRRQSFRLDERQVMRIGRDPDNTLILADLSCSRRHCEILYRDPDWIVRDLGSRNGTFVKGVRVRTEQPLNDGDPLQIGPYQLIFTCDPSGLFVGRAANDPDTDHDLNAASHVPILQRLTPPPRSAAADESGSATHHAEDTAEAARPAGAATASLLGETAPMAALREHVRRVARTEAAVLIRGESGVGKELVARAIHEQSRRAKGPFICLNCAALSETLLESELFGHERGAFTGATDKKLGKFELAHRGTLHLDEIGELSAGIQAKFLRVLEGQPYHRVGGGEPIQVDVRVVAATNRDLEDAVRRGQFRQDLYFRLHVVEIAVPPLRERPADIPLLAEHFLAETAALVDSSIRGFTPRAMERLEAYHWPGNVRELRNVVLRSMIYCPEDRIRAADILFSQLDDDSSGARPPADRPGEESRSLREIEIEHILRVLRLTGWNKSRAAEILDIERSTLDRKLKRHNIRRPRE